MPKASDEDTLSISGMPPGAMYVEERGEVRERKGGDIECAWFIGWDPGQNDDSIR